MLYGSGIETASRVSAKRMRKLIKLHTFRNYFIPHDIHFFQIFQQLFPSHTITLIINWMQLIFMNVQYKTLTILQLIRINTEKLVHSVTGWLQLVVLELAVNIVFFLFHSSMTYIERAINRTERIDVIWLSPHFNWYSK